MFDFYLSFVLCVVLGFSFSTIASDIHSASAFERLGLIIAWPLAMVVLAIIIAITKAPEGAEE